MTDTAPHPGLLVLNRADLVSLGLTWAEIIDVLDDAFAQKARGLVQNPPKPMVVPRSDAFINAMPAYLGGSDRAGLKWVAGFAQNHAKGLPYIYGVLIMSDAETGRPTALIDGGWVTEMRTPGVSGVTMRRVGGDPRTLAVIGCGVQGRRHLEVALECYPGIGAVRAYDYLDGMAQRFLEGAGDRHTVVASSPTDAVEGAGLVITCVTVRLDPVLHCANSDPDALLLPVDYDDAIGVEAINASSVFSVDDLGQYASVLDKYFAGYRDPDTHLAAVVAGEVAVPATGRRVFLNMGIAMDDVALGALVYDRALAAGAGRFVDFP